jgi:hypothetical protein
MPSPFAALENLVSSSCDAVFGERWILEPMMAAPGGGRRTVDAARASVELTGIYSGPNKRSTEFGTEARGSVPRLVEETFVSIDVRQVPDGDRPRRFDRLTRVDTGQVYEISHAERDAEGRIKAWIKELIG